MSHALIAKCLRLLLLCGIGSAAWGAEAPIPAKIEYNRDVRPILAEACFRCHGFDRATREADRRLDTRAGALAEKDGIRAIVPGDLAASEVHRRIHSPDRDEAMPPRQEHAQLDARQKAIVDRWIEQGAEYQSHWAYLAPVRPAAAGIDALVQARQQALGLSSVGEADRPTLVRRLHLDLLGLPPAPAAIDAFLRDDSAEAYAKLVERLLASPHYGERMAVWWLDLVRYADTIGYHSDVPRSVWPYRDYVIRAFNDNVPFDRFTREQLAGDLLPDATREQRIASAFNRLNLTTEEGGAQARQYEAKTVADRVRAVGTVWLGQTFMCAECHDHKYDPITARDFYSLGAFFADLKEEAIGPRGTGIPVPTREEEAELERFNARLAVAEHELAATSPKREAVQAARKKRLKALVAEYRARAAQVQQCLVSESTTPARTVRILPRGDWMKEDGEIVQPALPQYLPQPPATDRPLTRLDLAAWLVSRENPLPARVFVNRLWAQFFGTGLSKSVEDLGTQGEIPRHQALLDWLACEFVDSGWDVKHLVRLMVTSAVYRQSSLAPRALIERDPDARELTRQARLRLDAEFVRDHALTVSGLLVRRIGGPSVKPYQPAGYWENLNFPPREWEADTGENQWRRGLYTWWQRSYLHPSLLAFDAPSREECTTQRARSNTPQQALALLNDRTYVEAAAAFAARIQREGGATTGARLAWAWREATGRPPRDEELETLCALHAEHTALHSDRAAWFSVARVVLNLHETITRP